jgi:long-chain fatty acid transport protein
MRRAARVVSVCAAVLVGVAGGARAQSLDPGVGIPPLDWSFSSPGARAGAMGGAFIGVADDASSTYTNPAGLTNLTRPQVYLEFNNTTVTANRLATQNSLITGETTEFTTSLNALGFVNVAVPLKHGLAVAFTRHQFLNYAEDFALDTRFTPGGVLFNPVNGSSGFTGVSYIGSVAYMIHDKVRVGLGVSANQFDVDATSTKTSPTPGGLTQRARLVGNDVAPSFNVGVLATPSEKLSFGVVYAMGPKFSLDEDLVDLSTNRSFPNFPQPVTIHVPDRIGAGVGARVRRDLLITADAVYVKYSTLAEAFAPAAALPQADFNPPFPDFTGRFAIDDVTELHLGAEYSIPGMKNPIFVRGGVFTNPDHQLKYLGNAASVSAFYANALPLDDAWGSFNIVNRDTEVKGTIGAGFVVGTQFQTDVAYVFGREFIVSAAVRF